MQPSSQKIVYLNNAATSWPKPLMVRQAVNDSVEFPILNSERSGSLNTSSIVEKTRTKLHSFFSFPEMFQIAFIHSATVGLNLVIRSIIEGCGKKECHFVVTNVEHNSVYRPLMQSMKNGESCFDVVEYVDALGVTYENRIIDSLKASTQAVIISNASNVTGQVFNLDSLYWELQRRNILLIVDATQSLGCRCFSYNDILGDVIVCSTHKHMYSIPGAGFLAFRKDINLVPLYLGGTGQQSNSMEQPKELPSMLEAGTYNIPAIFSLNAAIDFLLSQSKDHIHNHLSLLSSKFADEARKLPEFRICHPCFCEKGSGIFSFNIAGMNPSFIVSPFLSSKNVIIRSGLHCAPQIHKTIGTYPDGANRVSFSLFTTLEDIDTFFNAIKELTT